MLCAITWTFAAPLSHRGIHILRHTFCSHLAMRGAPAKAIQELAGHVDLKTTQRYMHLSPAALESAIRLLETGRNGDMLETEVPATKRSGLIGKRWRGGRDSNPRPPA